jgi:hypothetical protein
MTVRIYDSNGNLIPELEELIHTSCSAVYEANLPAPLDGNTPNPPSSEKGDPSPNWFVLDFLDKDGTHVAAPVSGFPTETTACTFTSSIPGASGSADVVFGIRVNNSSGQDVTVDIDDDNLNIHMTGVGIAAGAVYEMVTDPVNVMPDGSGVYENTVNVTAGASCSASDSVLVKRIEPVVPATPVSCSDIKDLTALSMIWNGPNGVTVTTAAGEVFENIQTGNLITFQASKALTGNDYPIQLTGAVTGTSVFHLSCSDSEMDGTDDCGKAEGDGKSNDASLINQWSLDGMTGQKGSFACGLTSTGVVDPKPGTGGGTTGAVVGATVADLSDAKKFKWELTNNTNADVFITDVYVVWPADQGRLKKVKLGKDEFAKDVNDSTSPTSLPAEDAFESDANKRKLKKGETQKLEIEFTQETLYRGQKDFEVLVTFENAAGDKYVVKFSPATLAVTAAATLDLSDNKKVKWELTNNTTGDVLITEVTVSSWPAAHVKLKKMKLAADFAKGIDDTSAPTTVSELNNSFTSNPDDRQLKHGETKKLEIEFDKDVKNRTGAEYTIEVKFSNGNVVTYQ